MREVNVSVKHTTGHAVAPEQRCACTSAYARIDRIQVHLRNWGPGGCLEWGTQRALDACQRHPRDADVGRQHRHVTGKRLERSEAETLALRRDEHRGRGVDVEGHELGVDALIREQVGAHLPRERAGAVVPLLWADRIRREEQVAPVRIESELYARLAACHRL